MANAGKLNTRQMAFVREYLLSHNATDAARKAGYKGNDSTLGAVGHALLRNPKILPLIKKSEKKVEKVLAEKFDVTQEKIVEQLVKVAFADPMDMIEFDEKGRLIFKKESVDLTGFNFNVYPEYQSKADIRDGVLRARLSLQSGDRRAALELLGKHVGMWKDGPNGPGSESDSDSRKAVIARLSQFFSKAGNGGGKDGGNST